MSLAATEEKSQGTAHYKRGEFVEAIECYTRALGIYDEEGSVHPKAVVHNRALAYLQSKDFKAALRDADEAIGLDSAWYKPYSTKAYALSGLGRTAAAIACLMKGQGLVSVGRPKLRALEKFFDGAGGSSSSGGAASTAPASTSSPPPGAASASASGSSGSDMSFFCQNKTKTLGFTLNLAVLVFIVASLVLLPLGQMRAAFGTYRYALMVTVVRHLLEMWNDPAIRPRALSKNFAGRVMQSPWAAPIFFSLSSFFCKNLPAMLITTLPIGIHAGYGAVAYASRHEAHRGAALPGHSLVATLVAFAVTKLPSPGAATSAEWRALSGPRQWSKISVVLPQSIAKLEVVVGIVAIVTLVLPTRDVFHALFFWQYLRMRYMIAQVS